MERLGTVAAQATPPSPTSNNSTNNHDHHHHHPSPTTHYHTLRPTATITLYASLSARDSTRTPAHASVCRSRCLHRARAPLARLSPLSLTQGRRRPRTRRLCCSATLLSTAAGPAGVSGEVLRLAPTRRRTKGQGSGLGQATTASATNEITRNESRLLDTLQRHAKSLGGRVPLQ